MHRLHRHSQSHGRRITDVYHQIVCRHRIEVEVWPPRAEVYFRDDPIADPALKQTRFEGVVINSEQGYLWEVRQPDGSPGLGSIDETGLYLAPAKGSLTNGSTEVIVVTAREDRLRKAYAWVTLVGIGPQAAVVPSINVFPKSVNLYYQSGASNKYIDSANKQREFRAILYDGAGAIDWLVNGAASGSGDWFHYQAPNTGSEAVVKVRAQLSGRPSVFDEATVLQLNYSWP